jgi:hypothetical protein
MYHFDVLMYLLLNMGEPVITEHTLVALRPGPKRTIPKTCLEELLEFATEVPGSTWVGTAGPLKLAKNLSLALGQLNKLRGHRLRGLRLPPQWEADGVYQVSMEGRTVMVDRKFKTENRCQRLPEDQFNLLQDSSRLKIECNWSSRSAVLVEEQGVHCFPLVRLFLAEEDPFELVKAFVLALPMSSDLASLLPMLTAPPGDAADSSPSVRIPFSIHAYARTEMADKESQRAIRRSATAKSQLGTPDGSDKKQQRRCEGSVVLPGGPTLSGFELSAASPA